MNTYDAYEIHPCVLLNKLGQPVRNDDPTGEYYEQCDEDDPDIAVWALYGHLSEGGLKHISDHINEAEAEEALRILQKEQFCSKEAV